MLSAYDENNIQALAAIRHLTGMDLRLLPLDEITAIESTDYGFNVWITRYRWQDLKRGIRVTARGIVLVQYAETRISDRFCHSQQRFNHWYTRQTVAWDAEQCGEQMADAVRAADMPEAQHWMTLQMTLEKLGDFTPFEIPAYGSRETVAEWAARVRRERMAGGTGTSRYPIDTYDRVKQGYTTERMSKHWKRG